MPRKVHERERREKVKRVGSPTRNLAGLPPKQRPRKLAGAAELRRALLDFVRRTDPKPDQYYGGGAARQDAENQELAQEATSLRAQAVELLGLDIEVIQRLRKAAGEVFAWLQRTEPLDPQYWDDAEEHFEDLSRLLEQAEQLPHLFKYDRAIVALGHHQLWFVPMSRNSL